MNNISVPVGLITQDTGRKIESVLNTGSKVLVMLNWTVGLALLSPRYFAVKTGFS